MRGKSPGCRDFRDEEPTSVLGYLFQKSEGVGPIDSARETIGALAKAQIEGGDRQGKTPVLAPAPIAGFAQFLAYDLVACSHAALGADALDIGTIKRQPRSNFHGRIRNRRSGMLRLDSVYHASAVPAGKSCLSRYYTAFSRYHDENFGALDIDDPALRFAAARNQTCFLYQWIVLNELLPAICSPSIIIRVLEQDASIYRGFLTEHQGLVDHDLRPIPIEFAMAALRFIELRCQSPAARRHQDEGNGEGKRLGYHRRAYRELLRGYVLDLPSAQALIAKIREIDRNATFDRPRFTGFAQTPMAGKLEKIVKSRCPLLHFLYLEAGLNDGNWVLGSLGGRLVAEVLIGILTTDPLSFWNATGSGHGGRWSPEDAKHLAGDPVTSCAALLERSASRI